MGRLLNIDHTLVYRWVQEFGENISEPDILGEIAQMEFDEMWHFIKPKRESFGSLKLLTVAHGELWPECLAIIILREYI